MSEKIRVHVRVRNMNKTDLKIENNETWFIKDNLLHQKIDENESLSYICYESVFFQESNNLVFEKAIEENVEDLFRGKSLTVFAYGQTGSGKTYTMTGNKEDPGIIERVLSKIFQNTTIQILKGVISYFEIYNENIIDLINSKNKPNVFFYNDQVVVKGIEKVEVNDLKSSLDLIKDCERRRKIGQTQFNSRSSRSHTIFKLELKINGKLVTVTLIDLAGSEKASGSALRVKEGVFINKSLLALGKVMNSIHKKEYTNYRDSKLTRVLQPSMTGNVNLVALCMISPNNKCVDESVSTLKFASRLCQIEMKYQVKKNSELEEKEFICVNCRNGLIVGKKEKLLISDYSDSSSNDSDGPNNVESKRNAKLVQLQEKRISSLESIVISLLRKNPSVRENEIFTLEKNMYNLQLDILKSNKDEQT